MTVNDLILFLTNCKGTDQVLVMSKSPLHLISPIIRIDGVFLGTKSLPAIIIHDGETDD